MRRRRRLILAILAAAAAAAAVATLVLVLTRGGPTTAPPPSIAGLAAAVAHGATAVLAAAQQAPAGEQELHIMLPDPLIHPAAADVSAQNSTAAATFAAAGWRGALIAAAAATRIPGLTSFVTTDKAGAQASGAAFYLDGTVRTTPGENPSSGMTRLGTVTTTAARRQLDDNLRVLIRGLPAGSVTRATVTEVPVDPAHRRSAFAVELQVRDLRSISRQFGDLFDGLATGLAPGLASTVEGLSIHAVDDAGRNAGSWMAARAQQGTTVMDPSLRPPKVMVPRLPFVNETGGPGALASAHGGGPLR